MTVAEEAIERTKHLRQLVTEQVYRELLRAEREAIAAERRERHDTD